MFDTHQGAFKIAWKNPKCLIDFWTVSIVAENLTIYSYLLLARHHNPSPLNLLEYPS